MDFRAGKYFAFSWFLPAAFVLAFGIYLVYPGGFSTDSLNLYNMAKGGVELTDVKPVFATLLMRLGLHLFGDGGLIILNSVVFFGGAVLIASALFDTYYGKMLSCFTLVIFPPLYLLNLSQWIDPIVISGLSLSSGLILFYIFRRQDLWLLLAAIPFTYWAMLARHNAPAVLIFIHFLLAILLVRHVKPLKHFKLTVWLTALLLFGGGLAAKSALQHGLKVRHVPLWSWIYNYDLISISLLEKKNLLHRDMLRSHFRDESDEKILSELNKVFLPHHNWKLGSVVYRDTDLRFMDYAIETVLEYPYSLYVTRYRTNVAWLTLPDTPYVILTNVRKAEEHGITPQKRDGLFGLVYIGAEKLRMSTPLFRGYLYICGAFLLLIGALFLKKMKPAGSSFTNKALPLVFFPLAGLFSWLPLVPLIVSAEFRYLTPCVFYVVASTFVLIHFFTRRDKY